MKLDYKQPPNSYSSLISRCRIPTKKTLMLNTNINNVEIQTNNAENELNNVTKPYTTSSNIKTEMEYSCNAKKQEQNAPKMLNNV